MHEKVSLRMLAELRRHAADHTDLIRDRRHVREQLAHWHAAMAMAMKRPVRRLHGAVVVKLRFLHLAGHRLARVFLQQRLWIERVDVRNSAAHVAKDHAAGLRGETLRPVHDRCLRLHQSRQRCHAKACGDAGKYLAA